LLQRRDSEIQAKTIVIPVFGDIKGCSGHAGNTVAGGKLAKSKPEIPSGISHQINIRLRVFGI
jgi:hypothetical protein